MRLTTILRMPIFVRRVRDASWGRWRKTSITDLGTEKELNKQGIQVQDANEFVREMDKDIYPPDWRTLPDFKPQFPQPPSNDRSHPDWHDTPMITFDSESFMMEGVDQAQVFTKSIQIKKGLPDDLLERCHFDKLKDPNAAGEQIIKQAFLWDAYLEKLPNLKDHDFPTRKFRRQFGIPAKRSNEILITNFVRFIEQDNPKAAISRMISNDKEFAVNVARHNFPVQIKLSPMLNIMSKTPLKHLVEPSQLQEISNMNLPNIHPFLSTTNFQNVNIYKEEDFMGVKPTTKFPHIHTAVFSHHIPGSFTHAHPRWNDNRFSGTTVMYAFATAAIMAHRAYGNTPGLLPKPVTSQVVHVTGKEFQFAVFQLNTLDLDDKSDSKTKNILWLTDKIPLFSHVENKLGTEIFEGYNPEPFKILKGMYSSPTE